VLTFNLRNSAMLATRNQIDNFQGYAFPTIVYLILIAAYTLGSMLDVKTVLSDIAMD